MSAIAEYFAESVTNNPEAAAWAGITLGLGAIGAVGYGLSLCAETYKERFGDKNSSSENLDDLLEEEEDSELKYLE